MEAIYLGWQGWHLSNGETSVLADPLLHPETGRGSQVARRNFMLWPPRVTNWAAMPPVDAVLLSHEHDDHFDVRSIAQLDRSIPLLLSARSSEAARRIVHEMEFQNVRLVSPGETVNVGSLQISLFSADPVSFDNEDEWDVLAYAVVDERTGSGFFTNVDVTMTEEMSRFVRERAIVGRRTLCFHNLTVCEGAWLTMQPSSVAGHDAEVAPNVEMKNGHIVKSRSAPIAGDRFDIGVQPVLVARGTSYVRAAPTEEWPAKPTYWPEESSEIRPATAHEEFDDANIPIVEECLREVAESLYGNEIFKALYSLRPEVLDGRRPTFLWVLLTDAELGCRAYEYSPSACDFIPVAELCDPGSEYAGLVVTWANDLLALHRGEIEPRNIVSGYRETWFVPVRVSLFVRCLWKLYHPLRRPRQVAAQYRRVLEEGPFPVVIHGTTAANKLRNDR